MLLIANSHHLQTANYVAAAEHMQHAERGLVTAQLSTTGAKEDHLRSFKCGVIVDARRGGSSNSESARPLGFSCTAVYRAGLSNPAPGMLVSRRFFYPTF